MSGVKASCTVLAAALALLGTACSGANTGKRSPSHPIGSSSEDFAGMKARVDSARNPYTEADVHFMSGMIGHHAQAIAMASLARTHGANPSVQRLAERIINGQEDEIATMRQWLRNRNQPVPDRHSPALPMMMNGAEHHMRMPGMLTEAQLKELEEAHGPEFDRLFLSLMIQHHRGALTMVERLFGSHGSAQDEFVFRLASDVNVDQSREITRMKQMLDSLTSNPRHRP